MGSCSTGNCTSDLLAPVRDGVGVENPILRYTLGVCSALAVTGRVSTTVVMGAALLFVASLSSLMVSWMRTIIPHRVRLIAQMLVISMLVIIVHLYLRAYFFDMSQALGPYVGLIITNCIILGRCEAYAMRNGPVMSALDGFGSALGYALVLLVISLIREPLGNGTLFGFSVTPAGFESVQLIAAAPGAFLAMGIVVWVVRSVWPSVDPTEQHPEAADA